MELKCQGCTTRYPGCHDHCESYQAWKAEHDAILEKTKLDTEIEAGRIREMVRISDKLKRFRRK